MLLHCTTDAIHPQMSIHIKLLILLLLLPTCHCQLTITFSSLLKARIPLQQLSPKLPARKVVDTNHESPQHKS